RAPRRLVCLRVVDEHERRADALSVRALALHAADASGDPRNRDDRARRSGALWGGDGWQHDLLGGPPDVRRLALVELARGSLVDALQTADREARLGEVVEEEVVVFQFALDALQHRRRVLLVRADQAHK